MEMRENGSIIHDGVAIGSYDANTTTLTIDLGWAKAADLRVVVRDDPDVDRHRKGVLLDRG